MVRGGPFVAGLLVLANSAWAAPWARDPGAVFLSFSISAETSQDAISSGSFDGRTYSSIYGEVGLGRRLTAGFDFGADDETGMGQVFLRYTFTRAAAPWQFAADLGFARRDVEGQQAADLYRVGLSAGRGFSRGNLDFVPYVDPVGGWFSIDSYALIDPDGASTIWQSEATLGLNISERFAGMLQLKAEEYPGDELAVTVAPSFLVTFDNDMTAQLGARFGVEGSDEVGLRLGLWREF